MGETLPTESDKLSDKRSPSLGRIAWRGLRFRYLKLTGAAARPQALSLELTRRCIARCLMCNIWQAPRDLPELSAGEWLDVLASPMLGDLRELDVTGGEPFLRPDLVELFEGICRLKPDRFPHLSSIAVTTNGFLETDGSFSVIKEWDGRSRTALAGVTGLDTRAPD
jgi:hypothetical protein